MTTTVILRKHSPYEENITIVIPDAVAVAKSNGWCYGNNTVQYEIPEANIVYVMHEAVPAQPIAEGVSNGR